MTQQQLYLTLLMSVMMVLLGVKEMRRDNIFSGIFMLAIPGCYWLSLLFGKLPT